MIENIPCVILSGGKSSRMGEDKSFLPFNNTTLIEYQYHRLSKIFTNVYISSKINKFDFECKIIYDNNKIFSPMVALYSILKFLNSQVFIISVDTPFIKEETIKDLVLNSKNFDLTIAKDSKKTHNLCGVYSCNCISYIEHLLNKDIHKINLLVKNLNSNIVEYTDSTQFFNVNTKEDYKKICQL